MKNKPWLGVAITLAGLIACTPGTRVDPGDVIRLAQGDTVRVNTDVGTVKVNQEAVGVETSVGIINYVDVDFDLTLSEIKNLEDEPLIKTEEGNCAPFGAPQPYRFSGTSSAFLANTSGQSPRVLFSQLPLSDLAKREPQQDSGILIIDDFGGDETSIDTFNAANQDLIEGRFDADDPTTWPLHGPAVMNHLNLILTGTEYALETTQNGQSEWRHRSGRRLLIKAVDFRDASSKTIARNLGAAIAELRAKGIEHIIVNMSFAIVPCSVWHDYLAHIEQFATIEAYAQAIYQKNEGQLALQTDIDIYGAEVVLPSLIFKLTSPVNPGDDPLFKTIQSEPDVSYVASAGNYANAFSTYPAAWPGVVSISAYDLVSGTKADYSNQGEVMAAGGVFTLELLAGMNAVPGTLSYRGTSFAAPELTALLAFGVPATCFTSLDNSDTALEKVLRSCL